MIYLDNSATTAVCPQAAEKAAYMMTQCFGNPSSLHTLGIRAEQELSLARAAVGEMIGAPAERVFFTSGGTEANNLAILGSAAALGRSSRHAVTTAIEHPSVAAAFDKLEQQGWSVTRVMPDAAGDISLQAILQACRADTALISVMLVNNETGALLPILSGLPALRRVAPQARIHCDAVQGAGKLPLRALHSGIDLLSVSGHKLHAPKGVGALYIRRGVRLLAQAVGGGQEGALRSGTEAMPAIAAFGAAAQALPPFARQQQHYASLYQTLLGQTEALRAAGQVVLHRPAQCVDHIVNLSVPGYRSETLLHALAQQQVYVSSGSACSKGKQSAVLTAMGMPSEQADSALRLSFCMQNTPQDIGGFVEALQSVMQTIAKR